MSGRSESQRIVVTGVGPICALGQGGESVWRRIQEEKVVVQKQRCLVGDELWEEFFLHKMDDFDVRQFVPDKAKFSWIEEWKNGERDIDLELTVAAVGLALRDARQADKFDCAERVGLFLVHENAGLERIVDRVAEETSAAIQSLSKGGLMTPLAVKKMVSSKCQKQGYDTQTFMHLFFVGKVFGIKGYSLFMNNACSSGLFALEAAAQAIRSGRIDQAVVAGSDYPEYVHKYLWFKQLNVYARDGRIKPFAQNRDGMVFGDGGAALHVESLASARRRKAKIYAEYLGGGFGLEGAKVAVPDPTSDQYANCMLDALNEAGIRRDQLDLVVPHGIGEAVTDLYEARQIGKMLEGAAVPVTVFKPYVGHNLGNSAVLETCILMKAMQQSYIPSIFHKEQIDSRIRLNFAMTPRSKPLHRTLKLSCGFAGYNAAAVFGEVA